MYKIHDLALSNRAVTLPDGHVVQFENYLADVSDEDMPFFKELSDYDVWAHSADVVVKEHAEATPADVGQTGEQGHNADGTPVETVHSPLVFPEPGTSAQAEIKIV